MSRNNDDYYFGEEEYELQSHKKSDAVKWAIAFTLIAILLLGMVTSIIMAYRCSTQEKAIEQDKPVIEQPLPEDNGEIEVPNE